MTSPTPPCTFFLQGTCTRGAKCRFSHAPAASAPPPPPALTPPVALPWPAAPCPTRGVERALQPLLLAPGDAAAPAARSLGASRLAAIERAALAHGLHLPAALSLRAQLRSAAAGAQASDCALPQLAAAAAAHLAAAGVSCQAPCAPPAAGQPDLLLHAVINQQPVRWLNCSLHFGSGALRASSAALARAAQCRAAHGPGALLFLCGYAADLRCEEGVLPLDPAALRLPEALLQALLLPLLREDPGSGAAAAAGAATGAVAPVGAPPGAAAGAVAAGAGPAAAGPAVRVDPLD